MGKKRRISSNPAKAARRTRRLEQKSRSAGSAGLGFETSSDFEAMTGMAAPTAAEFNRMARRSCSECGSPVEWVDEDQARARGIDATGAHEVIGAGALEFWCCTSCDQHGAMSV